MKNLFINLLETLSQNNAELLQRYISKGLISDEDMVQIKNAIRIRKAKESPELISFLDSKGLSDKFLSGNTDFVSRLVNLFSNDHKILDKLKVEGGVCTFDEFKKGRNIFRDFCKKWEKEAKIIANIVDVKARVTNANVGPYEILMKILIKGACAEERKGDVCINDNGEIVGCEVKKGGKQGARVSGQKTANIHDMYDKLNEYMANECGCTQVYRDYWQKQATFVHIEEMLKSATKNKDDIDDIFFESLCKAVFTQYLLDPNSQQCKEIAKSVKEYNKRKKGIVNYSVNSEVLSDILGAIQVYAYAIEDGFDYITIYEGNTGDYVCLETNDLIDVNNTLKYIYFTVVGAAGAQAAREKTGRPCLR